MNERALHMLGLARRARSLELGEEPVCICCRSGRGRLVLLASDAGEHTVRRAQSLCRMGKPLLYTLPFSKAELGHAVGLNACACCVFTDPAFAKSFMLTLDASQQPEAVMQELSRQTLRVEKRRAEEKAHRNNLKHGKK